MIKNNILFVCPSESWGAKEREAIKDILASKRRGDNVYLFVLKDSFIDLTAHKLRIPVIHFIGKLTTQVHKWNRLSSISTHIKKLEIDIVHCYDENIIWPITFFLRNKPRITCILSVFSNIDKNYKKFLFNTLSKRIDLILNYNEVHQNNVIQKLGVAGIKVQTEYFPISNSKSLNVTRAKFLKKMGLDSQVNVLLFGVYVDVNTTDIDELIPLFNALSVFGQKQQQNYRLILFGEKNWGNNLIYPDIIKYVKDLGMEDNLVFYKSHSNLFALDDAETQKNKLFIEDVQACLDIWISLSKYDQLDDNVISSLVSGTPVLGPRVSTFKEFLNEYPGVGESFSYGDSREICSKLLELLDSCKAYKQNIKKILPLMKQKHDLENYEQRVGKIYQRTLRKRERLFKLK